MIWRIVRKLCRAAWPSVAPMWIIGPSGPTARAEPQAKVTPTIFATRTPQVKSVSSRSTPFKNAITPVTGHQLSYFSQDHLQTQKLLTSIDQEVKWVQGRAWNATTDRARLPFHAHARNGNIYEANEQVDAPCSKNVWKHTTYQIHTPITKRFQAIMHHLGAHSHGCRHQDVQDPWNKSLSRHFQRMTAKETVYNNRERLTNKHVFDFLSSKSMSTTGMHDSHDECEADSCSLVSTHHASVPTQVLVDAASLDLLDPILLIDLAAKSPLGDGHRGSCYCSCLEVNFHYYDLSKAVRYVHWLIPAVVC